MTLAREIESGLSSQDLPLELRRLSSAHQSEEPKIDSVLSGVITPRQDDDVICPYLLRRNLIVHSYPYRAASRPRHRR
jgi:hypothetical protein